jgi:peptidoglycan/LPS O-acetylase OafA/YrhL
VILIFDIEQNNEKDVEEGLRSENTEDFSLQKEEPRKKLKVIALIISGIGGILYLITVFMIIDTDMEFGPYVGMPFLIAGVISLMGAIMGVKDIRRGSIIILLSLPGTFLIGLIFSPYWDFYFYFITFVFVPIPLPHSILVIIGGILCLKSTDWKIMK